ncbi:hypothetical protein CAPTEDRAFT_210352 [Capitella teleta]|uniref:Uncharacterized protein n=1 Tax=Capitella teleta TaxID=283909 RepID=N1PB77_CAPTE|nr:hypothetical protein CAPTEDRAFT_210352 [Capitella teleta]|eukprot:ELU18876.1 hypothetical protein CAPTEDRAFT_210352 [Capitella teleta]
MNWIRLKVDCNVLFCVRLALSVSVATSLGLHSERGSVVRGISGKPGERCSSLPGTMEHAMLVVAVSGTSVHTLHAVTMLCILLISSVASSPLVINGVGCLRGNSYFVEIFAIDDVVDLKRFALNVRGNEGKKSETIWLPEVSLLSGSYYYVTNKLNVSFYFGMPVEYFDAIQLDLKSGQDLVQLLDAETLQVLFDYRSCKHAPRLDGEVHTRLNDRGVSQRSLVLVSPVPLQTAKPFLVPVIDVYGNTSSTEWHYALGWGRRISVNTSLDGSFDPDAWQFGGENVLTHPTENKLAAAPYPVGLVLQSIATTSSPSTTTETPQDSTTETETTPGTTLDPMLELRDKVYMTSTMSITPTSEDEAAFVESRRVSGGEQHVAHTQPSPPYRVKIDRTTTKSLQEREVEEAPYAPFLGTTLLTFIIVECVIILVLDLEGYRRDFRGAYADVRSFCRHMFDG